ncbi:MAG TPA: hypothetical protein VGM02_06265 [Acidobacteriaceae bacterium]
MALFGSDRPVMPTFKTSPELDSSARSPYDDLNRLERNPERGGDRAPDRNGERNLGRQLDRADERNAADLRAQERLERVLERNGREPDRDERAHEHDARAAAPAKQAPRRSAEGTDPLIQGLFSKLPEPETEWPLPARQKWLQTAANIFDLMYAPGEADAGELAIRVERNSTR